MEGGNILTAAMQDFLEATNHLATWRYLSRRSRFAFAPKI